jgi:rubrerythrin
LERTCVPELNSGSLSTVLTPTLCHAPVEHYEIARYGTLSTWANQLGMAEAATLLEETLAEEKKTDELLTQLARSGANPQAEQTSSASEDAGADEALEKPAARTKPAAKAKAKANAKKAKPSSAK